MISKDGRAGPPLPRPGEHFDQPVTEEDIVPQHEAGRASGNKIGADRERLGEALRLRLHRIGNGHAPLRAIAEQLLKQG